MRHPAFKALLIVAAMGVAVPGLAPRAAAESLRDLLPFGRAHRIAELLPMVVNISTRKITTEPSDSPGKPASQRIETFAGSGFIIDPSGLIVTNRHVIDGAADVIVTLRNGMALPATILGTGGTIDIALLKVDPPKPLPTIKWGNSDSVRVGDEVLAIGNPLALGETVTSGIVSATNRDIMESPFDDYIQTDAAINHGNSGGPLFTMRGNVIGVNTSLYTTTATGGSVGLGFAIPGNDVQYVVAQIRQFGRLRQGWIGLRAQDMSPNIADALGIKSPYGAIVVAVDRDSPAARAGLAAGDVVLKFGKSQPKDARALARLIAKSPIDSPESVLVWRDGNVETIPLTIAESPLDQPAVDTKPSGKVQHARAELPDLGLQTAPMNDDARTKYKLAPDAGGLVVTAVAPDSSAFEGGLQPGDVVLRVQETAVSTPEALQQTLDAARKDQRPYVVLLVQTHDSLRWVPLPVGAAP